MENAYCMGCMRRRQPEETVCPVCGFRHGEGRNPDFALPLGTQLAGGKYLIGSKYLIGRMLGRGGFGITYLGLDTVLGLKVAVKECYPSNMATRMADTHGLAWVTAPENAASIQRLFTNEARKIARMEEVPGIVKVREVFKEHHTEYIVMGYIDGETLGKRLKRTGPMDPETCLNLLRPVMQALSAAHTIGQHSDDPDTRNIIHRDISPDNIMIRASDQSVWVLDLGAAKEVDPSVTGPNVAQSTHLIVRSGFSPWEQYSRREAVGPWTDVYALCATAYYCMTGEAPPSALDRDHRVEELPIPAEVPEPVAAVLRKGLSFSGRNRQQSMNELLMEFEAAVQTWKWETENDMTVLLPRNPKPPAPVETKPNGGQTKPQKWKKWIVAVLVLVLLAVAGTAAWMISRNEEIYASLKGIFSPEPERIVVAAGQCGDNALWNLYDDGELYIFGTGDMWDWESGPLYYNPSRPPWEELSDNILSVTIEDGITSIGESTFYSYANLANISIPDSVTVIGQYAFRECTSLTSVTIPDSVTGIGSWAFDGCTSLTSVTIPDSVISIGDFPFGGCTQLLKISVDSGNGSYISLDGVLFNSDMTKLIQYPAGKNNQSYTVPDSVTEIGNGAFDSCTSLTSVTIPDSVTVIGSGAFESCTSLTSVTIPDSVTVIGSVAFESCTSLTSVIIPDSVTEIGWGAFWGCTSLTSVTIPDSVTKIGYCAFNGCTSLTSVTIPDSVIVIGQYAFYGCTSLTSVTIPDSVTRIVSYAFDGCTSLKTVSVPSGAEIDDTAFPDTTEIIYR